MAKQKTVYFCQNCGAESPKWTGRCASCGEWNTLVEETITRGSKVHHTPGTNRPAKAEKLKDIKFELSQRMLTADYEFNRVLGGGIVPGSLILLGGEPGIGKSTLALQIALKMTEVVSLYVSGEESASQIRLRAERLGNLENSNTLIFTETRLESILDVAQKENPGLLIIDSVQTLYSEQIESSPGSVSQVRESATRLLRFSKENNIPVLIIGHITKEGSIAGPKILEHIVDTVLNFEGDQYHLYRILRSAKNRFGSTHEIGVYEMYGKGLKEIPNPSEILISPNLENLSGVAVSATLEGIRPLLLEIQALVSNSAFATPQRSATGFDGRRLNMLLALLEKRAGFKLGVKDVFLNIAGGIRLDDPASDLAVISAILSSSVDIPVGKNICFAGELGLSGEIRPVNRLEQRISEAGKLGFNKMIVSSYNKEISSTDKTIELIKISKVQQIPKLLFG